MTGFGLALADRDLPADSGVALARQVDASDQVDSLWTNETGGAQAFATLGAWGASTSRVALGTGVVPLSARSTATLELGARQIAKLTSDRLILGIGVGQRAAAEKLHHREWRPPLEWTSSVIDALVDRTYPLIVGALGPKMLALAATRADGALLNWTTPGYASELRSRFDQSADAAGRDPSELLLVGYVRVACGPNASAALEKQVGFYSRLPFYREAWEAMGAPSTDDVAVASPDGSGFRDRLSEWDALDVVVARIVPTPEYGLESMVDLLT